MNRDIDIKSHRTIDLKFWHILTNCIQTKQKFTHFPPKSQPPHPPGGGEAARGVGGLRFGGETECRSVSTVQKISNLQQKNEKFSKYTHWKIFLKQSTYTGHIPASFEQQQVF